MKLREKEIININIIGFVFWVFLMLVLMTFNNLMAQESHEVGLTSGYTKVAEDPINVSLYSTNSNSIKFEVPRESHLSISLFDEYGNLVKLLLYDNIQPGIYEYDLTNQLPNGNYVCKLNSGDISEAKDLVLK